MIVCHPVTSARSAPSTGEKPTDTTPSTRTSLYSPTSLPTQDVGDGIPTPADFPTSNWTPVTVAPEYHAFEGLTRDSTNFLVEDPTPGWLSSDDNSQRLEDVTCQHFLKKVARSPEIRVESTDDSQMDMARRKVASPGGLQA